MRDAPDIVDEVYSGGGRRRRGIGKIFVEDYFDNVKNFVLSSSETCSSTWRSGHAVIKPS